MKRLDFTTCHIFLLNIYRDYEQEKISLNDFEEIINILESYFVRRWICKIPTRTLGKVFDNLYKDVNKNNPNDLVLGLRTVLKKYNNTQAFPHDASFRSSLIEEKLYGRNSAANDRVKFLLERIEETLSKEKVITDELTIEHVMPQKLTQHWEKILGSNYTSIRTKWLHTLGNLTLTAYNSQLSNNSFDEKVKSFKDFSNISLNKYFYDLVIWNEDEIRKRAENLANIAIKIWSR